MTTILVVDDNPMDQRLAGACVEEHGLSPIFASNGREALEMIERQPPDVVLTDLQMPELDGLQLVQKVRQSHSSVPVILMTAFGSEEVAADALRAGAASYVPKKLLRELLATGAEGNYIDYVSAEQAFMAVQMLVFEIGDASMKAQLDSLGDALTDDERYSPARFRALLAQLGQ